MNNLFILMSFQLIDEHKINPDIFVVDSETQGKTEKRAKHLGLCYRRTASGFSAMPCWKTDGAYSNFSLNVPSGLFHP